jgi:hypothetical protein
LFTTFFCYTGTKSLDVTSQQSLLARIGNSLHAKQPLCGIFENSKVNGIVSNTDAEKGEVLLWSYEALQSGKWPHKDHLKQPWPAGSAEEKLAGQDLAGGYCGVVYMSKQDLDYVAKSLHLRNYNANQPCDYCSCDRSAVEPGWWPTNFGNTSLWKDALLTADEWRALYPEVPHWLFRLEHFCHHNVELDELHIIWLGTAMWCNGSVLWFLVFRVMRRSSSQNMQDLWGQIVDCYTETGVKSQYTNLNIGSFCDSQKPAGHYPKLKAGLITSRFEKQT